MTLIDFIHQIFFFFKSFMSKCINTLCLDDAQILFKLLFINFIFAVISIVTIIFL